MAAADKSGKTSGTAEELVRVEAFDPDQVRPWCCFARSFVTDFSDCS